MIEFDPLAGTHIERAAKEAVELKAMHPEKQVKLAFNGVRITIYADMGAYDVMAEYDQRMAERAEARRGL